MDSAFFEGFWPCGEKVFPDLSTWSWTTTQVCVGITVKCSNKGHFFAIVEYIFSKDTYKSIRYTI